MGTVTRLWDGLANVLTGAGTSVDRRTHAFYALRAVNPTEVQASYRDSWLMRKIVDLPAIDMTRAGRDWQTESQDIEDLEQAERDLGLWDKLRTALILGRLGGGAIVIGVGNDPTVPLPSNIGKGQLRYMHVVSRHQITLGDFDDDFDSETYGEPLWYSLNGGRQSIRIHPSRVIPFKGITVPPDTWVAKVDRFWGDPVYRSVVDAVKNADAATNGFASLIDEANYDIIGIPNLMSNLSIPGYEAQLTKRVALVTASKSMHRSVIRDAEETWEQRTVSWSGMPDVMKTYLAVVAGAADIPATRLLGKSPDGMNATGDGDEANYITMISAQQESILRPALNRLDPIIMGHAALNTEDAWFDFAPLKIMSELERSTIALNKANMVTQYVNNGSIPMEALMKSVANMVAEDGTIPGLEQAIADLPDAAFVPPEPADKVDPVTGEAVSVQTANDAAPQTLYVRRDLVNSAEFIAWAKSQGFASTLKASDLHVTIAYSRTPIDWMKVDTTWESDNGQLLVPPGGARIVEALGDKGAVVLLFSSSTLSWRHKCILDAGASFDFDDYQPHVTITYAKPDGLDLSKIGPYRGKLLFGPEIFEPLDENWSANLAES